MLSSNMLLPNLIPLIDVTFSTPTRCYANEPQVMPITATRAACGVIYSPRPHMEALDEAPLGDPSPAWLPRLLTVINLGVRLREVFYRLRKKARAYVKAFVHCVHCGFVCTAVGRSNCPDTPRNVGVEEQNKRHNTF